MDASSADVVRVGPASLAIVLGDITATTADAIGNAANSSLSGGGGVDGAIHAAGGPAIMAELRRRYPAGTPTGTAVETTAGSLPARWVIHAVGPIWCGGRSREAELLAAAYRSAIRLADSLGASSLTLPAISAGIYGYPLAEAASIAIATTRAEVSAATTLREVTFVLRETTLRPFRAALAGVR
ncbi:MAG TPA: macro domain-containing protein [Candidatus Saccharimonadia bacterium]|nr:macro domain-containing protein [Candidatus Saccharimonadia bacterium]